MCLTEFWLAAVYPGKNVAIANSGSTEFDSEDFVIKAITDDGRCVFAIQGQCGMLV